MVSDDEDRGEHYRSIAATFLRRPEVIGTPIAEQVFDLVDAIYLQDGRFF
jgi:hypothetical protein